ncbi:MAG: GspMb/PilO family protein [Patescibacteria group bacterium]
MAKTFKPQTLRGILIFLLAVVVIGGAGLFYLGLGEVRKFAVEVNHSIADAEASGGQFDSLQALKQQLSQSEALIAKANQMFATPDTYQTQAITDISTYATAAGLTVTKTSFDEQVDGASRTMTVSLRSPVSYSKLIQFLDGIESNIPKMQVSNIAVSHVAGGGADLVAVDDIKIMIATR